ncbi:hypothetical protein FLA4_07260 [Candidatus Rickettsia kotlanii]|nr:hypothetical protein FLA4_07260 [Candidatus Rickettsia kotlanii]BDU61559.1 hypothetical protein HM2_07270 [Candidatus Rickettsia kotlanii]
MLLYQYYIYLYYNSIVTLSILGTRYIANNIKVHINSDYHDDSDQHNICLGQIEDQEALNKLSIVKEIEHNSTAFTI